jgi:hypothetical protein
MEPSSRVRVGFQADEGGVVAALGGDAAHSVFVSQPEIESVDVAHWLLDGRSRVFESTPFLTEVWARPGESLVVDVPVVWPADLRDGFYVEVVEVEVLVEAAAAAERTWFTRFVQVAQGHVFEVDSQTYEAATTPRMAFVDGSGRAVLDDVGRAAGGSRRSDTITGFDEQVPARQEVLDETGR